MKHVLTIILGALMAGGATAAELTTMSGPTYQASMPEIRTPVSFTQNVNTILIEPTQVACGVAGTYTLQNWYLRRFFLAADHGITEPLTVQAVTWGVQQLQMADGSTPPTYSLYIVLYSIPVGGAFTFSNMTELARATATIGAGNIGTFLTTSISASIMDPVNTDLVVAIDAPDGSAIGAGLQFRPGANTYGATRDAYIAAADCGISDPVAVSDIGFPNSQTIIGVGGQVGPPSFEGACCYPDGHCIVIPLDQCQPPNVYMGDGVPCNPNPCLQPGATLRVSVSSSREQGNNFSGIPSISANGQQAAFESSASNLVQGDTNDAEDVFVHDRQTGETTRASVSSAGAQGNARSKLCTLSTDARCVAFYSEASNLVEGDTNGSPDIFVHDRQTGQTTRMSTSSSGEQGNGYSDSPSISADGRYVAFHSSGSNLVQGDTNGAFDVFVHDRQTGQTTRVSISTDGGQGNGPSAQASISADGRYVAFFSVASNLVQGDTNGAPDVFVHDRQTGQTTRVSISSGGEQGNSFSAFPSISADGRNVAFHSNASNLVQGDTNGAFDVFVHDRQTGQTTRVSISSVGQQGNGGSGAASISADGRNVAFYSEASNLVQGDTNGAPDIFVHDQQAGKTARVSVSSSSEQGNGGSGGASISADGQHVAFHSDASNLVQGDTNDSTDVFVHQFLATSAASDVPPSGLDPLRNQPNPFQSATRIAFFLPESAPTALRIFDAEGRLVAEPFREVAGPGEYEVQWDGRSHEGSDLPAGFYYFRLESGKLQQTGRMILVR